MSTYKDALLAAPPSTRQGPGADWDPATHMLTHGAKQMPAGWKPDMDKHKRTKSNPMPMASPSPPSSEEGGSSPKGKPDHDA